MQEISVNEMTVIESEIITLTTQAQKMALQYIVEIGRRLTRAKELIGHGGWGAWLSEKVNYSQSTAENYMKIYKEFGEEQISLFSSVQSDKFQNLPYTKLLALTAISSEERDKLSENVDIEKTSVKELEEKIKEIKAERDGFENKKATLEGKLLKAEQTIEEEKRKVSELEEKIKATEKQSNALNEDAIREEYEEKLKKAKDAQIAAEKAKENLEGQIKEEKKKAALEATEKAKKAAEKQVQKEKEELKGKIYELERKLASAVSQETPIISVYFGEVQEYIKTMSEHFKKLKAENPNTYEKLSAGVKQTLHKLVDEI